MYCFLPEIQSGYDAIRQDTDFLYIRVLSDSVARSGIMRQKAL